MADNSEKFVLAFDVEMQMKKAAKQVDSFSKQLQDVTKEPGKFKTAHKKAFSLLAKELKDSQSGLSRVKKSLELAGKEVLKGGLAGVKARKQFKQMKDGFHDMEEAAKDLEAVIKSSQGRIAAVRKKLNDATDRDQRKAALRELRDAKGAAQRHVEIERGKYAEKKKTFDVGLKKSGAHKTLQTHAAKAGKASQITAKELEESRKTYAQVAKEIFESFKAGSREIYDAAAGLKDAMMSKDVVGSIKGAGELAGKGVEHGFKAGAYLANKTLGKLGGATMRGGAHLKDKGKAKGGLGGFALKQMGNVMQGMGGLMKGLGPLMGLFSKMGPLIATAASIFAGLVKVMIDAEAQAKQFNKDILESSGSLDMLYENGVAATGGFKKMDQTLDQIRSAAYDVGENLKWGINADQHKQFINTLNQEGVTLKDLSQSLKEAGQGYGDLTHMGVTYSRLFGVSLADIGTFSAEMFTEMGAGIDGISANFANMSKDAAESGIAANKFFSIIRNVSSDLALYNTRLGQAATILKVLGKAMSPKNAAKFMQTLTQSQKGMGEEDRIHQTLIVGEEKQRGIVTKDLQRKEALMYADLAKRGVASFDEIKGAAAKGGNELDKIISKLPADAQGAYREAIAEMKMDRNALDKGGVVGVSEAASNLSAAGAFASKKASLQRFGGNKKLSEMTGVQAFGARKATGTSLEEFRSLAKMEMALDSERKTMEEALAAGKSGTQAQQDTVARLNALGVTDKKSLSEMDDAGIIAAMEKTDQDALVASQEQTNWAEKQANLTSTMSDKLETIVDGIFEYLYEALKDIIVAINDFITIVATKFSISRKVDHDKEASKILREGTTQKNVGVVKAMRDAMSAGGPGDAKSKMISGIAAPLAKGIDESIKAEKDFFVNSALKNAKSAKGGRELTPEETAKATAEGMAEYDKNSGKVKMGEKGRGDLSKVLNDLDDSQVRDVMGMTGISKDKKANFDTEFQNNGGDFWKASKAAGLDEKDLKSFLEKSVWSMSPEDLAKILPNLQTIQAGVAPGAPTPTGQSGAAAKAAAPGTGGVAAAAPVAAAPTAPGAGAAGSPAPVVTPGAAAAAAGPAAAPTKTDEKHLSLMTDLTEQNDEMIKLLGGSGAGIKMNKSFLQSPYQRAVEEAVTDGTRKTLAEFALYTAKDPQKVLDQMKGSGFDQVQTFAEGFEKDKRFKDGFLTGDAPSTAPASGGATPAPKKAKGGLVTGIQSGMAVFAPPGEGLTSIGPGERILPRNELGGVAGSGGRVTSGGGGGGVTINVNGIGGDDLANYLRDRVSQLIYEYKRKEKFT